MILDPFRLYRRHQRLLREAREEAQHLRRRHGDEALAAARDKLRRPELTTWGHRVLEHTIKILRKKA
ncbi:hypothetical protein DJ021_05065 [Phenylobacterium hankyongense]|uniref:Uncharacterized protein n=1 Tax=Phenylobacterium hankyongense TaxID=1813876 RepID=A0A328B030_9CAUL|nr:hypothetical protein [Phenylobacterium hankyongense]RAK59214.1 hypothetical protein DJ021_05065 [Phenylobacterium hankyongense]